ncbi:MAG: hypothetical protein K0U39_06935, partial [Alphaproteobacteria bacterium]|nr:hypothetical protein [Alphaproteobacteria bacterium]
SGIDWNAKNSSLSYYDDDDEDEGHISTIADTLKWVEEEKQHKPHCIEALDYVKNHLKENNIILDEAKQTVKKSAQALFDELFAEMTYYGRGLDYDIDIPKEILKLETLIAQGANPNKKISFEGSGDYGNLNTPISYIFHACANDMYIDDADGENFYLDILKLLIDSGVDWNAKNIYVSYNSDDRSTTIADTLEWVEENADKLQCIEALNYVQNHLKENNITLAE